jgi:O-antigen/teichoic acid export membrane protein
VTDWGCARWLPRELALVAAGKGDHDAVHTANSLRLMIAAGWILLTFAMSAAGMMTRDAALFSSEFAALYLIAVASTDGVSDLIVARRTWPIAWAVAAGLAVFAVTAFVLDRMVGNAQAIVAAYVTGKTAEAVLLIGPRFRLLRFSTRHLFRTAGALWPFSLQAILGIVYARLSIFVVQQQRPASDVGLVGAAAALQGVVMLFPSSIALLSFPMLATFAAGDRTAAMLRLVVRAILGSAIGVTIGIVVLASIRTRIVSALHVPTAYIPFILAFLCITYLTIGTTMAGVSLQAIGGERLAANLSFVTLALSIAYQFVLIRRYGVWGVLYGTGAAELTSLVIFSVAAIRSAKRRFAKIPWSAET